MMDADAEEMKKWAEKTFMALLEHRKAYMMLLKNKAEEGDWKSVVKMMNWGVQEMAKKQKKEMAEAVFYFGHLLIGGSPDMSEWASAEESESPMPDELRHMMQLMEMMGGKH